MARTVTLVCGPPCSGKTTYVRANAKPGDLILDQDVIGAKAMNQALAKVEAMTEGTAWVIRCSPGRDRRTALAGQLGAVIVLLVPPAAELMQRAKHRPDRRRAIQSIRKWMNTEQRNPAPPMERRSALKASTTRRGYGYNHQKLRAALLPYAYGQPCRHCGETMQPGQPLDLDHNDERTGYRGMAHATCNRRDGAAKTNARHEREPDPESPCVSRPW